MLYVDRDTFKSSVSIQGELKDADVDMALGAASRAIEKVTSRRFWRDESDVTRTYTAETVQLVMIDDLASLTSVTSDGTDVTSDVTPEPLNATADDEPYLWLFSPDGDLSTDLGDVEVTGQFGWPSVPTQVEQIVTIIASKLIKRTREAPWGVVNAGGIDGMAMRLAHTDPDLLLLIGPLKRHYPVVL